MTWPCTVTVGITEPTGVSSTLAHMIQATDLERLGSLEELAKSWQIPVASLGPAVNALERRLDRETM